MKCWEGNLAMDQCPIQGGVVILLITLCNMETGISSGWLGQHTQVQTLLCLQLKDKHVIIKKMRGHCI